MNLIRSVSISILLLATSISALAQSQYIRIIEVEDRNLAQGGDPIILVNLNTASLRAQGKLQAGALDLGFFTDCELTNPIPFWIDSAGVSIDNLFSTRIFLNLDGVATVNPSGVVYMAYGDPAALASASDILTVFDVDADPPTASTGPNAFISAGTDVNYIVRNNGDIDEIGGLANPVGTFPFDYFHLQATDTLIFEDISPSIKDSLKAEYLTIDGVIDLTGSGFNGGAGSQDGVTGGLIIGSGTGGGKTDGVGAGYGGSGGSVGANPGGISYNTGQIAAGSGGAGADPIPFAITNPNGTFGGKGGGAIQIISEYFSLNGEIIVNGTNGSDVQLIPSEPNTMTPGGGGGSGGGILSVTQNADGNGTLSAIGGSGGAALNGADGGAGGAGGRIRLFTEFVDNQTYTTQIQAGISGGGTATNGEIGVFENNQAAPDTSILSSFPQVRVMPEVDLLSGLQLATDVVGDTICEGEEFTAFSTPGFAYYTFSNDVAGAITSAVRDQSELNFSSNSIVIPTQNGLNNISVVAYLDTLLTPACMFTSNVVNIEQLPKPEIQISRDASPVISDSFCIGADNLQVQYSAIPINTVFSGPNISGAGILDVSTLPTNSLIDYTANVTDANGCTSDTSFSVIQFINTKGEFLTDDPIELCAAQGVFDLTSQLEDTSGLNSVFTGPALTGGLVNLIDYPNPNQFVQYQLEFEQFGCEYQDSIQIFVIDTLLEIINAPTYFCGGSDNIQLEANINNGTWTGLGISPFGLINNSQLDTVSPSLLSYNYEVLIASPTSNLNCSFQDAVDIQLESLPQLNLPDEISKCAEASVQILPDLVLGSSGSPVTYAWTPAIGLSDDSILSPITSVSQTIQYQLYIQEVNSPTCYTSDSILISILPANFPADAGVDVELCSLSTFVLGNSSLDYPEGLEFDWTSKELGEFSSNPNPSVIAKQTDVFYLTVTDTVSTCFKVDSIQLEVLNLPEISGPSSIAACENQFHKLESKIDKGLPPFTSNWKPSDFLSNPNILKPTVQASLSIPEYTLTVSDGNGCESELVQTLSFNDAVVAVPGVDQSICPFDEVQLGLGNSGIDLGVGNTLTYEWQPAELLSDNTVARPFATVSESTEFTLIVNSSSSCSDTAQVFVQLNPIPIARAGNDTILCNDNQELIGLPEVDPNIVQYIWSPDSLILADGQTEQPLVLVDGETEYQLIVINKFGCSDTSSAIITGVEAVRSELINIPEELCDNDGEILINPIPASGTFFINGMEQKSTSYTIEYEEGGLPLREGNSPTTLSLLPDGIPDGVLGINAFLAQVEIEIQHPRVSDLEIYLRKGNDSVALMRRPGIPESINGCTNEDILATFMIDRDSLQTAESFCGDSKYAIQGLFKAYQNLDNLNNGTLLNENFFLVIYDKEPGQEGRFINWSLTFGEPLKIDPSLYSAGTVQLEYDYDPGFGCITRSFGTFKLYSQPIVDAGFDQAICFGENTQIGGNPTVLASNGIPSYNWSPKFLLSNSNVANPIAKPETSTDFILQVSDLHCVADPDTVTVTIDELPDVDFTFILNGREVQFDAVADSIISYNWVFGDGTFSNQVNPRKTYSVAKNYTVCLQVVDFNGCSNTICKELSVFPATSIEDRSSEISVFPNPATQFVNLNGVQNSDSYTILNMDGTSVLSGVIQETQTIDISSLPNAVYTILVNSTLAGKIVKQ